MIYNEQKFRKLLFLGPKGSYSDAAKTIFAKYYTENCEFIEISSIYQIAKAMLESSEKDIAAILPIENSIEGVVRETQDNLLLLANHGIKIMAEGKMLIEHSLVGYASNIDEINIVQSHPQALAQCREYLFKTFGDKVPLKPTYSTSVSIASLESESPSIAAIGSEYCAKIYDVPIIKSKINDEPNNTTRFILLSKFKPNKEKNNKISIMFSTENKSGALNKALTVLEKYNLNLSYIDSRPSKKELGEYVFYADFAGYIDDNNVSLALIELQTSIKTLSILSDGAILY